MGVLEGQALRWVRHPRHEIFDYECKYTRVVQEISRPTCQGDF